MSNDEIYNDDRFEELGQIAPHSPETEVAILGSIILDNDCMNTISRKITPKDFYLSRHQRIYEAMLELHNEGANIDYVILNNLLLHHHSTEESYGGMEYLTELQNKISYIPSIDKYIEILKKHSTKRNLIRISRQVIEQAYDMTKESVDILDFAQAEILKQAKENIDKEPVIILTVMKELIADMKAKAEIDVSTIGLSTGISGLDELTLGLCEGLTTIGGRPSMGKSSLMINLVRNIGTVEEQPVLIFSAEMNAFQIVQNALSDITKVDLTKILLGATNDADNEKIADNINVLAKAPIYIDDTSELTASRIRTVTRQYVDKYGVKAIFIDYLQLINHKRENKASSEAEAISETVRQLKSLATELHIPVVVLAQINRQVEKRQGAKTIYKPIMSELKGSGGIEEHSDVVILIHREFYYSHKRDDIGKDCLIVAKNRRGRTGEVAVQFIPECVRFEQREAEDEDSYMENFNQDTFVHI